MGDLRDECAFTALLLSLAPIDHLIFTSVDRIIRGPLASADLSDAKHLFGVKFWGGVVVAKALAAHDIVSPGGSLTLTSGAAALRGSRNAAIGAALNGAVISMTQSLAAELADKRIRVNTVVPGLCRTELWDKLGHSREAQERVLLEGAKELSVGFVGSPEDVAEAYLYLARADYANGTTVVIGEQIYILITLTFSEKLCLTPPLPYGSTGDLLEEVISPEASYRRCSRGRLSIYEPCANGRPEMQMVEATSKTCCPSCTKT